jgi:hypothetical protein
VPERRHHVALEPAQLLLEFLRRVSLPRLLIAVLLLTGVVASATRANAASLAVTWNAPTTNADGTPLTDLAGYHLYLGTTQPACPGASFLTVPSPTAQPAAGQTVNHRVTGLNAGATYFVRITAIDTSGNESACSPSASGVAQPVFSVTPTTATTFGSVTTGGMVDRTFTVQNTSTASISGGANVGAPFSIASGGSFSLSPGASRTVTLRFQPTSAGSFASNVNFTASGDTISRGVSGSATAGTALTLSVTKNGRGSGTVKSSRAGIACGSDCTEAVAPGTRTKLTAKAASGSVFAGWSGACGGTATCAVTVNTATTVTATFNAAVPVIRGLSRTRARVGGVGFTLTVRGHHFGASSVVHWNGAARPTTFVNGKRLRITISADDLATAGLVAVSVVTPGAETSETITFTITAPR